MSFIFRQSVHVAEQTHKPKSFRLSQQQQRRRLLQIVSSCFDGHKKVDMSLYGKP